MSVKSIAKKAFKANAITEEEYKQLLSVIKFYYESLKPKEADNEWPSEECRQEHDQLLGWLKELKDLRLENKVILRRLKHLLESDYISQFDQVDPNTKEYIRNIKEKDELVKALNYDRNQYEKGVEDAKKVLKPMCRNLGKCMSHPEISREYYDYCNLYREDCKFQCFGSNDM